MADVSVKLGKTDKVFKAVREQELKGLSLIHEVDPMAAFLPKPGSLISLPIFDSASFSEQQFITGLYYFVYNNPYALFLAAKMQNSRWVQFSVNMGFQMDPKEFLPVMKGDLMEIGIPIEWKLVQALCTNIVFWSSPKHQQEICQRSDG